MVSPREPLYISGMCDALPSPWAAAQVRALRELVTRVRRELHSLLTSLGELEPLSEAERQLSSALLGGRVPRGWGGGGCGAIASLRGWVGHLRRRHRFFEVSSSVVLRASAR